LSRIRSIHPGQPTDESFVSCTPFARLLAIFIRNEADDHGIFEWKPLQLKMRIFPADAVNVAELLSELEETGQVARYESGGKPYGIIRNFLRFQRVRRPHYVHPLPLTTDVPPAFLIVPANVGNDADLDEEVPDNDGKGPAEVGGMRDEEGGKEEEVVPPPPDVPRRMLEIWKAELGNVLAVPKKLNDLRRQKCRSRFADSFGSDEEQWRALCQSIRGSPFLLGENERGWRADFDFALGEQNILKIQEGKYGERLQNGASPRRPSGPATGIAEGFARAIAAELGDGGGGDFPAAVPLLDDQRKSRAA
jgi:hypothetical protein